MRVPLAEVVNHGRGGADPCARLFDIEQIAIPAGFTSMGREHEAQRAAHAALTKLAKRVFQPGRRIAHPEHHRKLNPQTHQPRAERGRLTPGYLVERRASADRFVMMHDVFVALARNRPPCGYAVEERANLIRTGRPAEANQDDRAVLRVRTHFRLISCTESISARTWSTGVSGRMPWPRLKMWPGRPAAWSRIARTRRRISGRPAKSTTGSRLPCTPTL